MEDLLKILLATVVATSAMTAFSYYVSEKFRELFKEPVLLNILLKRFQQEWLPKKTAAVGWILHYVLGLVFVLIYHAIWTWTDIDPTWFTGLIFGIVSGIAGIISWIIMFKMSNHTPKIKFKQYYLQLFFAHIVFAMAAIAVYRLFLLF